MKGAYDTGFIADHMKEPTPEAAELRERTRSRAFTLAAIEGYRAREADDRDFPYTLVEKRGKKTLGDPVELEIKRVGPDHYLLNDAGETREVEWRLGTGTARLLCESGVQSEASVYAPVRGELDVLVGTRSYRISVG